MFADTYFSFWFFLFFSFLFVTFLSRCFIYFCQGWLWNLQVRSKCKSLQVNKYRYVKLKGSLLSEYLPIFSLLLFGVAAGRSVWKFTEPQLPAVAIHNCFVLLASISRDHLYFLPLFKRGRIDDCWTVNVRILFTLPEDSNNFVFHDRFSILMVVIIVAEAHDFGLLHFSYGQVRSKRL